ncbi:MAG: nucleotidyltransferase domain-containing protein [Pseudomonadota bacterium]
MGFGFCRGEVQSFGRYLISKEPSKYEVIKMITERDKDTIIRFAKKYGVSTIILFGSSSSKDKEARDIDIGVKGIDPRLFFTFYAELFKHLSKPVDLIDLSKKSLFTELVEETGEKIYG